MLFQALSGPVLSAVSERYYKVTAEALRVCGEVVRVVRPSIEVILLSTWTSQVFWLFSNLLNGFVM